MALSEILGTNMTFVRPKKAENTDPRKNYAVKNATARGHLILVTRPKYPPYRETGVAIPLSHCVVCGIADYRCYTPTSFLKNGLSQSKTGLRGGYRRKSLPLKPIAV